MKCPKCQANNSEGLNFCEECGERLELVCPSCGHAIAPGKKFCGKCGKALSQAVEIPPVDYSQPQSYTPKFLAEKILTTYSSPPSRGEGIRLVLVPKQGLGNEET